MNGSPMSMFNGLRLLLNMGSATLKHYRPHLVLQENEQDARPSVFALPEMLLATRKFKVAGHSVGGDHSVGSSSQWAQLKMVKGRVIARAPHGELQC